MANRMAVPEILVFRSLSGEAAEEADETPTVIGETTPYVGAPSIQNQTIFRTWPLSPGRFELIKVLGIGAPHCFLCAVPGTISTTINGSSENQEV
jgi:hypothetical protein